MKNTGIKVQPVSVETMLNDKENAEYNPAIWKKRISEYAELKDIQFYVCPKDEHFVYDRFIVSYTLPDGLRIIKRWYAFSAGITSRGFIAAYIFDGEIHTKAYGENQNESIVNTKEGREWLINNVCRFGGMVTNDL